jgi:hypothetical protein
MKKLVIIGALVLFGCNEPNEKRHDTNIYIHGYSRPLEFIKIDGCEYLLGDWGNATVLIHKGNCGNDIHNKIFKSE